MYMTTGIVPKLRDTVKHSYNQIWNDLQDFSKFSKSVTLLSARTTKHRMILQESN